MKLSHSAWSTGVASFTFPIWKLPPCTCMCCGTGNMFSYDCAKALKHISSMAKQRTSLFFIVYAIFQFLSN